MTNITVTDGIESASVPLWLRVNRDGYRRTVFLLNHLELAIACCATTVVDLRTIIANGTTPASAVTFQDYQSHPWISLNRTGLMTLSPPEATNGGTFDLSTLVEDSEAGDNLDLSVRVLKITD